MSTGGYITTSWDDGHPLDLRVAGMLAKYGLKGTFYVPTLHSEWTLMSGAQVRELSRMGMEIGSHTVNHMVLPEADEGRVRYELTTSKRQLEQLLGLPVTAFCFPKGRFSARTCELVCEAGYRLARTTVGFRTDRDFDPSCMPVSVQFVPHSRQIHLRHALKEGNARGLLYWGIECRFESDLGALCRTMMNRVAQDGGVFHIWGHSWEVDRLGLWDDLEETLRTAKRKGLHAATNSELV